MIEVVDVAKTYGTKEALRGVSFTVRPGEATGYLGPNGAGKTTTIKMIAGLIRPTRGQVRVCGFDVMASPLEVKRRIGYVPESAALYDTLTPNEHLSLMAELHGLDRREAARRIGELLGSFALRDAADQPIESLSKGMRQKVLLSAAFLHDPEVLLLDEPLNGLDVASVLTFRKMLEAMLARGKTVLYCSHILDVIERVCASRGHRPGADRRRRHHCRPAGAPRGNARGRLPGADSSRRESPGIDRASRRRSGPPSRTGQPAGTETKPLLTRMTEKTSMSTIVSSLPQRLGIEPRAFRALARAMLLMDLRNQAYTRATATKSSHWISPLFWVVGQCLTVSAITSLVLFMRVDCFFYALVGLSTSMLVMAATVVVEYHEIVLNPQDLEIIGVRPVTPATYVSARLANLLFYLVLIFLALNIFPVILAPPCMTRAGTMCRPISWPPWPATRLPSPLSSSCSPSGSARRVSSRSRNSWPGRRSWRSWWSDMAPS